ncbi:MAG TPA: pectate lyase [Bryobacterales bacterium]|nr:pectate lyase [Bryobacterales bacterium]
MQPCSCSPHPIPLAAGLLLGALLTLGACAPQAPEEPDAALSPETAAAALHRATAFYRSKVSVEGAYQFVYTEDLSYGRSEQARGLTQASVQRAGTPVVGMAYLEAYAATGDKLYLDAARDTALALVRGQVCSGGWSYIIEFDPQARKDYPYRAEGNCDGFNVKRGVEGGHPATTLDDNVTQAAVRVMMRVDRELDFKDKAIHEAALTALDSLIRAQYPNGAWPQRYSTFPDPAQHPVKRAGYPESWPREWPGADYRTHYTFNDNSVSDVIDMMLEASRIYDEPKYLAAAERGGDFMLLAQMPDPQPGWAQQYDADMHPAWARIFEPPSVTGGESQGILKTLLLLYRETGKKKYLEPIPRALDYYESSVLPPTDKPSPYRARACPPGSICMARFYELKTNKPLYITKGTRVNIEGRSAALLDGYKVSYSDESVITHYGVLTRGDEFPAIRAEYERIKDADPSTLRRPDRLSGLSPWSRDRDTKASRDEIHKRAAEAIAALSPRGAWIEQGVVDPTNSILQLFAAEDMTITIGDQVHRINEDDFVRVFQGEIALPEKIIRSETFARNVEALAAYLEL